MSWLAQIIMFLVLGLFATPSQFPAILLGSVVLGLFLIFVARPAGGLALPAAVPLPARRDGLHLLGRPARRRVDPARHHAAARRPRARPRDLQRRLHHRAGLAGRAGLDRRVAGPPARPHRAGAASARSKRSSSNCRARRITNCSPTRGAGSPVARGERIPRWARPSLVVRDGRSMRFQDMGRLMAGDHVYIFVPDRYPRLLDRLFASRAEVDPEDADFFGAFAVDPGATRRRSRSGLCAGPQRGREEADDRRADAAAARRPRRICRPRAARPDRADRARCRRGRPDPGLGLSFEPVATSPRIPVFLSAGEIGDRLRRCAWRSRRSAARRAAAPTPERRRQKATTEGRPLFDGGDCRDSFGALHHGGPALRSAGFQ